MAADGTPALPERRHHTGLAYDDRGDDERPVRHQDQAGHDEEHQADPDPDPGQDGCTYDREEIAHGGGDRCVHAQVRPAVPHVLHGLDHGGLHQERGGELDDRRYEVAGDPGGLDQDRHDDRGEEVQHESDGEEVGGEAAVKTPGFGQHARQWVHSVTITLL